MRRREFIALLGGAAFAWPFPAPAQQGGKVYRIAWAHPSTPVADLSENSPIRGYRTFFHELRRRGYVEGQNLIVERYSGEGHREHEAELAHDAVRLKPDLIFAPGLTMAREFKSATTTIPIVTITADPVAYGLVTSLAHPGGNVTGVVIDAGLEIWGKRLALLKETVLALSRVGFLATRPNWERGAEGVAMREAAQRLGIAIFGFGLDEFRQEADYRHVFAAMSQDRVDALVVSDEPENFTNRRVIVELAEKAGLPAIYPWREHIELGGLMAYAYDLADLYRNAARQIDKILKGAKPAEIPFYQSTKFELLINLKTANALHLTIPESFLIRADEVIE